MVSGPFDDAEEPDLDEPEQRPPMQWPTPDPSDRFDAEDDDEEDEQE